MKFWGKVLFTLGLALTPSQAIAPTVLPILNLIGLNGQPIASNKLPSTGQWLILYVRPNCRACDTALHLANQARGNPGFAPRLVIVGSMTVAELKRTAQAYAALAGATWSVDPSNQFQRLLRLPGAPVVLGVRQKTVQWTINGVLSDTKQFVSLLTAWTK